MTGLRHRILLVPASQLDNARKIIEDSMVAGEQESKPDWQEPGGDSTETE